MLSYKISRRNLLAAGLAVAALPQAARNANAQSNWPTKPIRIVVPYPVGGQTDIMVRTYGDYLSRNLGQPVIVDNKSGANGILGAAEVKRSAPDGYTLLLTIGSTLINNVALYKQLPYDPDKDFVLISSIAAQGLAVIVKEDVPAKNLTEFVAFAKKGGKVSFGTYGPYSAAHLTILELNKQYGLTIEPVHYRGEAPMWSDVMSQSIDGGIGGYFGASPVLNSKRGRVIAASTRPIRILPNLKTLREQGATSPFFELTGFAGLFGAPAGTPIEIIRKLSDLMVAAGKDEKVQASLAEFPIERPIGHEAAKVAYVKEALATRAFMESMNIPKQ
jgi:tripartite-type tricarboxylate transporter receptor subunit TctC